MRVHDLPWWAADFARPPGRGPGRGDPGGPGDPGDPGEPGDRGDPPGSAAAEETTAPPRGSVSVRPGAALARVPGRRFRAVEVRLEAPVLRPRQWETLFRLFSEQALYPAALLAGYLPRSARGDLGSRGVRLIPPANRVALAPSGLPEEIVREARHSIAAHFAADPFHLLHFRGRDRAAVLAGVQRGWRAAAPPSAAGNGAVLGLDELEAILEEHGPASGARKPPEGEGAGREPKAVPGDRGPLLRRVQQAEAFRGDPVLRANLSRLYTKVSERAAAVTPRSRPARPTPG